MIEQILSDLLWLIEVQPMFFTVLYRPLDRKVQYPLWLRNITPDGIDEMFKIYTSAKDNIERYQIFGVNEIFKIYTSAKRKNYEL